MSDPLPLTYEETKVMQCATSRNNRYCTNPGDPLRDAVQILVNKKYMEFDGMIGICETFTMTDAGKEAFREATRQ